MATITPIKRTALVLYGSETGNSQDAAEELAQAIQRLRFSCLVLPMDSVTLASLSDYTLVLMTISTTGQGDMPANSRLFWKHLLRRKLRDDHLSRVNFALFGLGDSSYPKFNWAALKLFKRLQQLGATAIVAKGEGDEQHPEGVDSMFLPWVTTLREKILELFPLPPGQTPIGNDVLLQPQWLLDHVGSFSKDQKNKQQDSIATSRDSYLGIDLDVVLESNNRVTPSAHWQDVRHLEFRATRSINYEPGDILTIYPENNKEDVDQLLLLLGWQNISDKPIYFKPNTNYVETRTAPIPTFPGAQNSSIFTLRDLLTRHLDLNAIPRRSFFSIIQHFTDDEFQKVRLQEFTDPQYTDELFDYTSRPRRSILEVLQEFDTLKIPWQWAASILPPLRGRQFSIASGGSLKIASDQLARFELLVAIVKYRTIIRKIRRGTCTRYLEGLSKGAELRVTLLKGNLDITRTQSSLPIVMIGPGTGVAPIRSLIHERLAWLRANETTPGADGHTVLASSRMGQNLLFFGCRNEASDFFFRNEWEDLKAEMPLRVLPAFSRDQQSKLYVQDLIREHKQEVFQLLHDLNGIVFICGSSGKMPQAVREALVEAFEHGLSSDREAAEAYLNTMEKENRYKQETW